MSKLIMVASGKGGSGTTTFTVNLGVVLANTGAKVLICDMNIGLRNDDIYLGMENRVLFDLDDYLSGVCSIEKAVIPSDCCDNLWLLPCPQCKSMPGLNVQKITPLFQGLKHTFDYILVDCPVSIGRSLEMVAASADVALLITTPDFLCIRNTDAVNGKLKELGVEKRFYVINKVTEESLKQEPSLDWISQTLAIPMAGLLSLDPEIHQANNNGTPIVQMGSSYFVKSFIEIAARIVA
ncbi:MAG: AAA family ATPase [Firmicutes bacterium]|nr:AAA family ATPase [Bacillota bacterium]MBR0481520.1 AAA family ATPase [Bacillota bacterium]